MSSLLLQLDIYYKYQSCILSCHIVRFTNYNRDQGLAESEQLPSYLASYPFLQRHPRLSPLFSQNPPLQVIILVRSFGL
jgi:hypothetical protein